MKRKQYLKTFFTSIIFLFLFLFNTGNSSYLVWNEASESNVQINEGKEAVCYNNATNIKYTSIEKALSKSSTGQTVYVIPGKNPTITTNCTIPSGVTLCLPYEGTTWDFGKPTTALSDGFCDSSDANISKYRVSQLKIVNSTLTISTNGNLYVGGKFRAKGVCGLYSEITLNSNSHIDVYGTFINYGYIKEIDGKNPFQEEFNSIDNKFNNEIDENRYIEVFSGGLFKNSLAVYNNLGASYLYGLNNVGICPIDSFDFPNTQTYLKVNSGGSMQAQAKILVTSSSGDQAVNQAVTIISNQESATADSVKPVFFLESGYMSIENCPKSVFYSDVKSKTLFNIAGTINVGYLYIDLSAVKIDTTNMFLPISYKFDIHVKSSAIFTSNYKIKFLAGSGLYLDAGSLCNLNSDTILYNSDTMKDFSTTYPTDQENAYCLNNGKIILGTSSHFGGHIVTNSGDGSAVIDGTAVNQSNLVATSTEGSSSTSISFEATGDFYINNTGNIESKLIAAGQQITSCSDGKKCWANGYIESYTLTINVINPNNFIYPASAFKVYRCNSSGPAETLLSSEGKYETDLGTYNYFFEPNQKFKVLSLPRALNNEFTMQSNNNYTFTSGATFTISGNIELTITAGEGILMHFTSSGESGNSGSTKTIFECDTSGGTFETLITTGIGGSAADVIIGKNQYFKYKYTKGDGFASFEGIYQFDGKITKTNSTTGGTQVNSRSSTTSDAVLSDKEYTLLAYMKKGGCFAKGTKIMMGDGTIKAIEDIAFGDKVMTWNFFKGCYEEQYLAFVIDHGENLYETTTLDFSDGTSLSIIDEHGLFDYDLNEFVYLNSNNYSDYIGHEFVKTDYKTNSLVKLINGSVNTDATHAYSITSAYNFNSIANGLLTAPPPGEFYNWIKMGEKMMYDSKKFHEDIETYGLYQYSKFEPYGISYETFEAFNGKYLRIPVEKGIFTFEYIIDLFNIYIDGF